MDSQTVLTEELPGSYNLLLASQ